MQIPFLQVLQVRTPTFGFSLGTSATPGVSRCLSVPFAGVAGANGRAPLCRGYILDLIYGHVSQVHPYHAESVNNIETAL